MTAPPLQVVIPPSPAQASQIEHAHAQSPSHAMGSTASVSSVASAVPKIERISTIQGPHPHPLKSSGSNVSSAVSGLHAGTPALNRNATVGAFANDGRSDSKVVIPNDLNVNEMYKQWLQRVD